MLCSYVVCTVNKCNVKTNVTFCFFYISDLSQKETEKGTWNMIQTMLASHYKMAHLQTTRASHYKMAHLQTTLASHYKMAHLQITLASHYKMAHLIFSKTTNDPVLTSFVTLLLIWDQSTPLLLAEICKVKCKEIFSPVAWTNGITPGYRA
jgi:hypothetical protein